MGARGEGSPVQADNEAAMVVASRTLGALGQSKGSTALLTVAKTPELGGGILFGSGVIKGSMSMRVNSWD